MALIAFGVVVMALRRLLGRQDLMRRPPIVILAIFVLSGAAALIDEIVWSRQLVLVFGNTTQAVSAILAGFFGGIAVGSFVGGRIADRVRVPLRMYGFLELVLAVVVVADAVHVPADQRPVPRHLPEPRGVAPGARAAAGRRWPSWRWRRRRS